MSAEARVRTGSPSTKPGMHYANAVATNPRSRPRPPRPVYVKSVQTNDSARGKGSLMC